MVSQEVVKKNVFVCDILFKKIEESEVHAIYDNRWCISKEAVRRLPKDMRDATILECVMLSCGQKDDGFQPEWLHRGIWVLEKRIRLCTLKNGARSSILCPRLDDDDPKRFQTIEDAMAFIKLDIDIGRRFWVFNDGILLKAFQVEHALVEVFDSEFQVEHALVEVFDSEFEHALVEVFDSDCLIVEA